MITTKTLINLNSVPRKGGGQKETMKLIISIAVGIILGFLALAVLPMPGIDTNLGGSWDNAQSSTTETETGVASKSTEIIGANTARVWAICTNLSTSNVYLSMGGTADIESPIYLQASESFEINSENPFRGALNGAVPALSGATTASVSCSEL